MSNRNNFRSFLIAKRISYAGISFSVATMIVSLIIHFVVLYFLNHPLPMPAVVRPRGDYNPLEDYFSRILPSMIICSICGLIIFTVINRILSKKLKNINPTISEKELKLIQKLESFKFKRIQEYGYLF